MKAVQSPALLSAGSEADCVLSKVDISVCLLSRLTRLGEKASQARQGWTYLNILPASQPASPQSTARQFCPLEMNCWLKSHD